VAALPSNMQYESYDSTDTLVLRVSPTAAPRHDPAYIRGAIRHTILLDTRKNTGNRLGNERQV
jgi:hypothetical protein